MFLLLKFINSANIVGLLYRSVKGDVVSSYNWIRITLNSYKYWETIYTPSLFNRYIYSMQRQLVDRTRLRQAKKFRLNFSFSIVSIITVLFTYTTLLTYIFQFFPEWSFLNNVLYQHPLKNKRVHIIIIIIIYI